MRARPPPAPGSTLACLRSLVFGPFKILVAVALWDEIFKTFSVLSCRARKKMHESKNDARKNNMDQVKARRNKGPLRMVAEGKPSDAKSSVM